VEDVTEVSSGLRRRSIVPASLLRRRKKPENNTEPVVYKSLNDIKLALSEFYLSLILLQNYQSLNFTGFRKILKKHDKVDQFYQLVCLCHYSLVYTATLLCTM